MGDDLLCSVADGVATVTLTRPAKRNALNRAVLEGLVGAFERLEGDPTVRVVVVRGAGPAFCSGMDLDELARQQDASADPETSVVSVLRRIEQCRHPTLAVVHGDAFAGGCELALHCDLRVAAEPARFAMPLARLGLVVPFTLGQKLVEIIGPAMTRQILMVGRPLTARRAYEIGMVHEVVAAAELERAVEGLARTIAANAPLSLRGMKRTILRALAARDGIDHAVAAAPYALRVRIAEEWAMVDILSGGRLEFGLGRGYQPNEFRGFGVSMERTRERFDECLEIIRRAWTEERVTFEGEFYTVRDVRVLPKPIQKPHPPFWTAAVSPDTYTLAARKGFKILTAPSFTPWDILRKNFDAYRAAWREAQGTDAGGDIAMNKIIHVADTSKQAREDLREPTRWFFRTQADLIADPAGVPPAQYKFYRRVRENLMSLSEDKALEQAAS